jgi:hypothetical protein
VQHVRVDHDPERELLQMRELRHDERLRLDTTSSKLQIIKGWLRQPFRFRGH